jgi:hypothetical protein
MRHLGKIITASLLAAVLISCAGASDNDDTEAPADTSVTVTQDDLGDDQSPDYEWGTLPDLTGLTHQAAQNLAQENGFYDLSEVDGSGQGRMLIWDRNWKVCSQDPAPGDYSTETVVTLNSVKEDEPCV